MFGEDGALVGLQGALLLDHRLSLGLAGYGWTNSQAAPADALGNPQRFETGYGGATIRYSLYTDDVPVYFTVGALVGGGAVALVNDEDDDFDENQAEEFRRGAAGRHTARQPHAVAAAGRDRGLSLHQRRRPQRLRGKRRQWLLIGGQVQFGRF